jgi:hypothetical protein
VLLNDGLGRFSFQPLPRLAQAAPAFGIALEDMDGDGHLDLLLAQNFYSPQPETGRMDGGLGLMLRGRGDGSFAPLWPDESGLVVVGDAKALVVVDFTGRLAGCVRRRRRRGQAFQNSAPAKDRRFTVNCGHPGNRTGIGARMKLLLTVARRESPRFRQEPFSQSART